MCNSTYCDTADPLDALGSINDTSFVYYTTSEAGLRLERSLGSRNTKAKDSRSIKIDATKRYQSIKGFGNAYTDAAALDFAKMTPEVCTASFNYNSV